MSEVLRTIDPPPTLSPPSECVLPPHQRRGDTHSRAVRGWGINISEDAIHWIGLLQYNPFTYKTKSLPSCIGIQCSTHSPPPPPARLERFSHRVGRVLSFSSSRPNWDSPNPSPAGKCAPLPPRSGGRGTLTGERGWESPNSRGDIHCGTLYIYVLCGFNLSPEKLTILSTAK